MSKRRKDKIEKGVLVRGAVISIAIAAISFSLIPGLAAQGTGDTVNVTVNAPEYVEGTFNASIDVANVTDFNSGEFDLSFNSSVENVTDVKVSDTRGVTEIEAEWYDAEVTVGAAEPPNMSMTVTHGTILVSVPTLVTINITGI